MQVYKFGGASVKDAESIKNVARIVTECNEPLCIIVSAMGKTTNALEVIHRRWFNKESYSDQLIEVFDFHSGISEELEIEVSNSLWKQQFDLLEEKLNTTSALSFDESYDQFIPFGEILSTSIIHDFWIKSNIDHHFIFATDFITTDALHREARVLWKETIEKIKKLRDKKGIILTQGFIGQSASNTWTTLGREGSDYSASIFAHSLDAHRLTIWKDVPGMLNADPKKRQDAKIIHKISYQEAIELAYYGASVIHPKTIQPLESKQITLRIASFLDTQLEGTSIGNYEGVLYPSCYIEKDNQILISISTKDFSFVVEDNILEIFHHIHQLGVKVQMMENSALSFSLCVQCEHHKLLALIDALTEKYNVRYNEGVKLLTVRHYNSNDLKAMEGAGILMEQKNRTTVRWVVQ